MFHKKGGQAIYISSRERERDDNNEKAFSSKSVNMSDVWCQLAKGKHLITRTIGLTSVRECVCACVAE